MRGFFYFCSDIVKEYSSVICESMLLPSFFMEYRSVGWWKTTPLPFSLYSQSGCSNHSHYGLGLAADDIITTTGQMHHQLMQDCCTVSQWACSEGALDNTAWLCPSFLRDSSSLTVIGTRICALLCVCILRLLLLLLLLTYLCSRSWNTNAWRHNAQSENSNTKNRKGWKDF